MKNHTIEVIIEGLDPLVKLSNFLKTGIKPEDMEIREVSSSEKVYGYFLDDIYYALVANQDIEVGYHLERCGYSRDDQFYCAQSKLAEPILIGEFINNGEIQFNDDSESFIGVKVKKY